MMIDLKKGVDYKVTDLESEKPKKEPKKQSSIGNFLGRLINKSIIGKTDEK